MSLERLMQVANSLNPGELAEVIDFATHLRARPDETTTALDAIAADPERLANFRAAIAVGWEQSERGEGRPADEVFAEIRKQTQQRREQG